MELFASIDAETVLSFPQSGNEFGMTDGAVILNLFQYQTTLMKN
jgi:hypothetical protein